VGFRVGECAENGTPRECLQQLDQRMETPLTMENNVPSHGQTQQPLLQIQDIERKEAGLEYAMFLLMVHRRSVFLEVKHIVGYVYFSDFVSNWGSSQFGPAFFAKSGLQQSHTVFYHIISASFHSLRLYSSPAFKFQYWFMYDDQIKSGCRCQRTTSGQSHICL